ncbi:MAG TPA: hypothetical protein VKF40_22580 [Burkholderiales bacterium]|nr:hypothetical protein [Burkholderiales bacterium]
MLKWIGGGKVDHPMADAKQARQIIADLPANDAAKALKEITEWLDSINRTEGFKVDRRFDNLDLLDSAAKNHQRKLSQEYLSTPRQQKFQEHTLWNSVSDFWRALGDGYIRCVNEHEDGASGAGAIRKNLPTVIGRALRVLTLQLKWVLLRYGPVEPRLWSELARLYQIGAQKGFTEATIAVYPGAHGESTIKREFLKSLMLAASSTDGLPPMRQQIAERAVAQFADAIRLSDAPEGCNYCFDLSEPKPPVRLYQGAATSKTMLFFGAGDALSNLRQLTRQVVETGAIPKDINLGGTYEKDIVIGTLRHLEQYWSDTPPARSSERRKTTARITVVPGFNEIIDMIDPASSDALDFSEDRSAESWLVENVSDGGYGAMIPTLKADWIKVGSLIGVQSEGKGYWGIGMIRRITRDERQQRRVGIQLLSRTAIPIKLARSSSGVMSGFNIGREPGSAILLSTAPDEQGEVGVVMREGIFNARDTLEMVVREKAYRLVPCRMIEGGEDFDWAKFRVTQRTS